MKKLSSITLFIIPWYLCCCGTDTVDTSLRVEERAASRPVLIFFNKVYETSFETASKKGALELNLDLPHTFEFAARHQEDGGEGDGQGGARIWVDSTHSRSGRRSIGLELFDIEKSRRSEFVIFPDKLLGKEYFVSYWLYLPQEWGLYDPDIDWDWFEIGNPFVSMGLPYSSIFIANPDEDQRIFTVSMAIRDRQEKMTVVGDKRLLLPKGRWFQVSYYVRRDPVDGQVKFWFDGQLIADQSGLQTASDIHDRFTISIAKIYHERGDKTQHRLWIDDLSLYTKDR